MINMDSGFVRDDELVEAFPDSVIGRIPDAFA
jgi:hypothetical protein